MSGGIIFILSVDAGHRLEGTDEQLTPWRSLHQEGGSGFPSDRWKKSFDKTGHKVE